MPNPDQIRALIRFEQACFHPLVDRGAGDAVDGGIIRDREPFGRRIIGASAPAASRVPAFGLLSALVCHREFTG